MSPVVPNFDLRTEGSPASACVIVVRGEVHLSTAPQLGEAIAAAAQAGSRAVVVDMAGVEFIDSTGLSVLLSGLRLVTQQRGRMAIACTNATVLRLFHITHLDRTFDIVDDRAQAIARVLGRDPD